ncbi:heavy metal translocating P-type ATPase [Planktotalea arctica]|uniref:heavy metal translocating P-type ATPase n=1 Tax=Planktotalea arctica TaxID=1481893 RepID=UPI000A16E601|nr:heavy metal translocating P-type ATPase [Planktotalea arctica]
MSETFSFSVTGLSCASCAVRAEGALNALPGITQAQVNFATGMAEVQSEGPLDASVLKDALDAVGKPARADTVSLNIDGMTCASCVARVEKALQGVPGVLLAEVNLATGRAEVQALGTKSPALIAAVKSTGKSASLAALDTPQRASDAHGDDAASMKRAFLWAALLTLPVFILEMGGHAFPAFHHLIERTIGMQASWAAQFVLTALVIIGPGRTLWRDGLRALLRWQPDMNALVLLGSGAAFFYSVLALLAPSLLPAAARAVYFEAAAVILTLILAGRWMEARAKGRTGAAITRLIALRPATAMLEQGGARREVAIETLSIGDVICLRPGERVAVDGTVLGGESWVDESMLTGEPVPAQKAIGARVTAGTVNGAGALTFKADAIGADTVLSQIIEMVQKAQGARLPVQNLVNKITAWFVPAVLVIAALTVAIWLALGPDPALTHALVAGVAVLIIACPCAMGLATPTSIMVGTGRAAELGVLFAKGAALQELQSVKTVAFDKTGTLSIGRPSLTNVVTYGDFSAAQALGLAAAAEVNSEHPIARALIEAAQAQGLDLAPIEGFESITGGGVRGHIKNRDVLLGNARLLGSVGIEAPQDGFSGTEILLAVDGTLAARFEISDPLKPSAVASIAALKAAGLTPVMITGDSEAAAQRAAQELGITRVIAGVLPGGKSDAITELQKHGPVAFVGDGINDAPALAQAEVGIAIGTGTDVAIEAADVVLLSGDLAGVQAAFAISHATLRNIKQNLFWAFGYNVLLIPVAAGALYPVFGVLLSPALAAGAMALSSVFVLSNALRLRRAGGAHKT